MKQHILIRPDDLVIAAEEGRSSQINEWQAAIRKGMPGADNELTLPVLTALYEMGSYGRQVSDDTLLVRCGISSELAGKLAAFIQSAAARVLIGGGVKFSGKYYWMNNQTRRAQLRRYDQTLVFTAATEILAFLHKSKLALAEISIVAESSAEMNLIRQAQTQNVKLEKCLFSVMIHTTDEAVEGDDIDRLLARPEVPREASKALRESTKPWWKFW